jgi:hypothetical protein
MGERHAVVSRPIARRKDRKNPEPRTVKQSEFPEGMTVEQTTDWVSADKERAQAALDYEHRQPTPRTSLITALERITSESTGAGIASGEA